LRAKADEIQHIDRLAIVRLSPLAETGGAGLDPFAPPWKPLDHESLRVILLNTKQELIKVVSVFQSDYATLYSMSNALTGK
jgi:hypothetical protein